MESKKKNDPLETLDPIARLSIRGLYGGPETEGMDERVWGDIENPADRERCLRIAVLRMMGEGLRYNGRMFRRILQTVIEEQSDNALYFDVAL